jgi:hypothetical protein
MIQNAEPDTFAGKSSDRIANLEGEISSNLFGGGRRQCPFSDNRASFQENTPFVPYSAVHTGLPPIKNVLPNLPSLAAIHPLSSHFPPKLRGNLAEMGNASAIGGNPGKLLPRSPPVGGNLPVFSAGYCVNTFLYLSLCVLCVSVVKFICL